MNALVSESKEISIWQELRDNIRETEVWLRANLKSFLDEFNITQQQLTILRVLKEANHNPLSTKQLQAKMLDKGSDTSRLVDRLIDKGLVRKRKDPNDRRLVQVFIKYEGLRLLAQVEDKLHQLDNRFGTLSEQEALELNRLLIKARA